MLPTIRGEAPKTRLRRVGEARYDAGHRGMGPSPERYWRSKAFSHNELREGAPSIGIAGRTRFCVEQTKVSYNPTSRNNEEGGGSEGCAEFTLGDAAWLVCLAAASSLARLNQSAFEPAANLWDRVLAPPSPGSTTGSMRSHALLTALERATRNWPARTLTSKAMARVLVARINER